MPDQPKRLHQVLGTKDEAQQVARVQSLATPAAVITIVAHPAHGVRLTIMTGNGAPLHAESAYAMLEAARAQVREMELAQLKQQAAAPPAEPPAPPPEPATPPAPAAPRRKRHR